MTAIFAQCIQFALSHVFLKLVHFALSQIADFSSLHSSRVVHCMKIKLNMEEYSEIASQKNTSLGKKCIAFFRKHRFQVTLEPVVCFVMLSLGLNQVPTQ